MTREQLQRKRKRQRDWYRHKYATNDEWARRERARKCEYWRRKLGWYEPGGMATDEEMAAWAEALKALDAESDAQLRRELDARRPS